MDHKLKCHKQKMKTMTIARFYSLKKKEIEDRFDNCERNLYAF